MRARDLLRAATAMTPTAARCLDGAQRPISHEHALLKPRLHRRSSLFFVQLTSVALAAFDVGSQQSTSRVTQRGTPIHIRSRKVDRRTLCAPASRDDQSSPGTAGSRLEVAQTTSALPTTHRAQPLRAIRSIDGLLVRFDDGRTRTHAEPALDRSQRDETVPELFEPSLAGAVVVAQADGETACQRNRCDRRCVGHPASGLSQRPRHRGGVRTCPRDTSRAPVGTIRPVPHGASVPRPVRATSGPIDVREVTMILAIGNHRAPRGCVPWLTSLGGHGAARRHPDRRPGAREATFPGASQGSLERLRCPSSCGRCPCCEPELADGSASSSSERPCPSGRWPAPCAPVRARTRDQAQPMSVSRRGKQRSAHVRAVRLVIARDAWPTSELLAPRTSERRWRSVTTHQPEDAPALTRSDRRGFRSDTSVRCLRDADATW